jgi:hypothetical protein
MVFCFVIRHISVGLEYTLLHAVRMIVRYIVSIHYPSIICEWRVPESVRNRSFLPPPPLQPLPYYLLKNGRESCIDSRSIS